MGAAGVNLQGHSPVQLKCREGFPSPIPVLPVLPGGGTFTLEEKHLLGVSLVVFAGGIFLGIIQEYPDSDTVGCDCAAAGGKQWNYLVINTHVATSAQDPSRVLPKAETTCECGALRS